MRAKVLLAGLVELEVGVGAVDHGVAQALPTERSAGDGACVSGIRLSLRRRPIAFSCVRKASTSLTVMPADTSARAMPAP